MTTERTPTTSAVRMAYSYVDGILGKQTRGRKAEFDRWLAQFATGVLDAFFAEMDDRHWSTSTDDVEDARSAALERATRRSP